jgi:hypothetical protein
MGLSVAADKKLLNWEAKTWELKLMATRLRWSAFGRDDMLTQTLLVLILR